MSFRKRNIVLGAPSSANGAQVRRQEKTLPPGLRPSPLDGRLTTSTGTSSLDQLLAGHAGMPLGTSLLVEETGTTDFGGTLLRYYAAEGLVQGHQVHLLGFGEGWRRELPGLVDNERSPKSNTKEIPKNDKMKIAWRYETLANANSRHAPDRVNQSVSTAQGTMTFCHAFDLTKRLDSGVICGGLHTTQMEDSLIHPVSTPFRRFLTDVYATVKRSTSSTVHRIVIPGLLLPTLYASTACRPQEVIQFLHGLRSLLREFPSQLTAMVTMPVTLFPRSSGLTRMMELFFDGVLELIPLQHQSQISQEPGKEDKFQGLCRVHSLPVFHEKGGGLEGSWTREDLSFKLSASSGLVITPFILPPIDGEEEAQNPQTKPGEGKRETLEF